MKKMLFTAIALVAFAGTSMANTIDEKKEIQTKKEEEFQFLRKNEDCAELAFQVLETIENEEGELSDLESDYYFYSAYSACLNN